MRRTKYYLTQVRHILSLPAAQEHIHLTTSFLSFQNSNPSNVREDITAGAGNCDGDLRAPGAGGQSFIHMILPSCAGGSHAHFVSPRQTTSSVQDEDGTTSVSCHGR